MIHTLQLVPVWDYFRHAREQIEYSKQGKLIHLAQCLDLKGSLLFQEQLDHYHWGKQSILEFSKHKQGIGYSSWVTYTCNVYNTMSQYI